jgi:phosphohistidine phosphatase
VELFVLRHGKAGARTLGASDAERSLTGQGREEIKTIGRWMVTMGYTFDLIATSPLKRARETTEIIGTTCNQEDRIQVWTILSPGSDPDPVIQQIATSGGDGSVLIIGHEPLLSGLISRTISGNGAASILLAKGGFARIKNISVHGHFSGELHSLITPKQLCSGN